MIATRNLDGNRARKDCPAGSLCRAFTKAMRTLKKINLYSAPPETVFNYLDDLGVTGMHMTKSSMMMMGSKLNLKYLTPFKIGPGTQYRWTGKMMGMDMDFTVIVTKWIAGREKTWETIGPAKLIIYSWYRMHLDVAPIRNKTCAELSISYERPAGLLSKILSLIFGDLFGRWCLSNMLTDTERSIRKPSVAGCPR